LFQGVKKQLEANAAAKPQYGNLTIEEITEQPSGPDSPSVRVTLRRTQLLEIESNDRELMHDFLDTNWNETEIAPEKQAPGKPVQPRSERTWTLGACRLVCEQDVQRAIFIRMKIHKRTAFKTDSRRKHHHWEAKVFYKDGETFARVYTDHEKAVGFAEREKKSPVVKMARVTQIS
jgi:hypothetical protein